jgi:Protein involved in the nuclear export of pre-ribosomes
MKYVCCRYAHCINLEFYEDIVNVLNQLLEHEPLGYREQLHCIQTVFTILSGQGEVLHIDPFRFYVHLYRNLLSVHAGNSLITCFRNQSTIPNFILCNCSSLYSMMK